MACHLRAHQFLQAFILIIWFSFSISSYDRLPTEKSIVSGFRLNMIRRESLEPDANDLTFMDRMARAVERSRSRQLRIYNIISRKDAETPVGAGSGDYVITMAVGTPSVSVLAIMDTGSDLVWAQCQPCTGCSNQTTPIFDPSKSSSYSKILCSSSLCQALPSKTCISGCDYTYQYGDSSQTEGTLSYETWTIGNNTSITNIAFGCGTDNSGFDGVGGLVGLGRGPLSLISQLGSKVNNKFSYCLVSGTDTAATSPLIFGETADLGPKTRIVPLVQNSVYGTFYYVPLKGISVGGSAVDIPAGTFDIQPDGSGGLIVDSGTTLTILDSAAYGPLKQAFQSAIQLPPAAATGSVLDLCYTVDSNSDQVTVPSLTLHFEGGSRWDFPAENYFVIDSGYLCLAMMDKSTVSAIGPSILGNILQQNFHILFDNSRNTISFWHADCSSL